MYLKKIAILIVLFNSICYAQRIDQLGKAKPVTITGGLSANSIFYNGTANRDAFTYFLNGNINANLYGLYNIPVSFAYTNQKFSFNDPSFKINRLSLHPSYKWIAAHIGDVSMSFSPYTLNGHQFTGFGFDLTPNGPFKISAMYGRLIRDREYNIDEPEVDPSYKRMGYGLKTSFEKTNYAIGLTVFKAKDQLSSLNIPFPDDIGITPKENLVVSVDGKIKIFDKGNIHVEYANSALTNDLRTDKIESNNLLSSLFDNRISTTYHDAFKADFSYTVGKGSLGVGYERIDPQYQTLGAYYFNNDLENITVKLSQTLFNNKLNVNINAGLQRDDLDKQKQSELSRLVTAINLSLKASEKLTVNGSYSNFRAHTQIKDQFDYINEVRPFDNLDTLNFTQISQNANLNVNYSVSQKKEKRQSVNINLSYQNTAEKQDGFLVDVNNNDSQFFNGNMAYNVTLSEKNLSITAAFNSTYNTIADNKTITLGPTLAIAKQFFDKKMRTTFSSSYNTTSTGGEKQGDVMNFRLRGSYRYKENHNFNLNIIQLLRNSAIQSSINDFTATFGYSYTFSNKKKKQRPVKMIIEEVEEKPKKVLEKLIRINHKGFHFEGSPSVITRQLDTLNKNVPLQFMDESMQKDLNALFKKIKASEKEATKTYKKNVIGYLDTYDSAYGALRMYQKEIKKIVKELASDILQAHNGLEQRYIEAKGVFNSLPAEERNDIDNLNIYNEIKQQFVHHSWIVKQLQKPEAEVLGNLHIFNGSMLNEVETMRKKNITEEQIAAQIKLALIAYFDEQATKHAKEEDILILNKD